MKFKISFAFTARTQKLVSSKCVWRSGAEGCGDGALVVRLVIDFWYRHLCTKIENRFSNC